MTRIARIYTLSDNLGIRYVGYTIRTLEQRLQAHQRWARRTESRTHRALWLQQLPSPPTISLIEEIDEELVDERERYWIKHYRELGCDLVNCTDGGKGTLGHKQSPEQIEARTAQIRGRTHTDVTKAAISVANLGRKRTPETRALMSALKRNKPWTVAQRAAFESRYGPKPAPADPRFCDTCGKGPFKGIRGLHRHADNSPNCLRPTDRYGALFALARTPERAVYQPNRPRRSQVSTQKRERA